MRLPSLRRSVTRLPWQTASGGSTLRSTKGLTISTRSSVWPRTRFESASR